MDEVPKSTRHFRISRISKLFSIALLSEKQVEAVMHPKVDVEVEGYAADARLIIRQGFTIYTWYEELHPLIDENEERRRLGVVEIRGCKYAEDGSLSSEWQALYTETGAIRELRDQHEDGTSDIRTWREDGTVEHTHFPALTGDSITRISLAGE